MKILDYSPIPFDGGSLPLKQRLKAIFEFGFSWVSEMKSQEVVIRILGRVLDNRYTMLRNVPLPESDFLIPLALLGPQGVLVICDSPLRGFFRASGDSWEIMDNKSRNFKRTRPNLIARTTKLIGAMENFLNQMDFGVTANGVLIFTDPGIHVNTQRSDVRVILMDAIEQLGAQLLQAERVLSLEDVQVIINALENAMLPEEQPEMDDRVVPHQQVVQNVDSGFKQAIAPLQKKLNFDRRQWMLLIAFVLIDIIILIGFVVFILLTA